MSRRGECSEMRRGWYGRALVAAVLIAGLLAPGGARAEQPAVTGLDRAEDVSGGRAGGRGGQVKAGVARVDASWHVGASAGQYASDGTSVGDHGVDPSLHSTRRSSSYGLQSRSDVRALVIQGGDGQRVAVVSNDLYIPQDLVNRRVATILEERDERIRLGLGVAGERPTGITDANLVISVSHSHSSPYYSTPSWGVWTFQDVFDLRFFEYIAQRMAEAVIAASAPGAMVPVQMGAARVPFDAIQRHSFGPTVADDGTPAGYPQTDNDKVVEVLRFDDVSGSVPEPLATWVIFGLHPEMLSGNDLLSGEYVHSMYRFVDREVGGGHVTLFSQNNTGTSEPARNGDAHPTSQRAEYSHREYAQMERAARLFADAVHAARAAVDDPGAPALDRVAPARRFPVKVKDLRFAPPGARLLPSVSNCRTEQWFHGNPAVQGPPECIYPLEEAGIPPPFDPGVTYDLLRQAGVPVPDNLPLPSYTGLQETVQVHLQAVRLGDVGITVCPCEQWSDQSRNIKSRLDDVPNNLWVGFDWTEQDLPASNPRHTPDPADKEWCTQNADTTWTCGDPRGPTPGASDLSPVTHHEYQHMVAQVKNNACTNPDNTDCWDDLANALEAEAEPWDAAHVWGNFIHEELDANYPFVVTVGMTNDYWGYIATYREFQRGDHYRKSLSGLGPHSMDFLATRLSRMAAELKGGDRVTLGLKDRAYAVDDAHQRARAHAIGEAAEQYVPLYEKTLPADGGTPTVTSQPSDVKRFEAARIAWVGGSNWFDLPDVKIQRNVGGTWRDYADQTGEVQALVHYPQLDEDLAAWAAGQFEWVWEATFEVFASDIALTDASGSPAQATPPGQYRFVIDGSQHDGLGVVTPYSLTSDPFTVGVWDGIQVRNLSVQAGGAVSFDIDGVLPEGTGLEGGYIDYPDSYASPFRFVAEQRVTLPGPEVFCLRCSFRPWADAGTVSSATVRIDGSPAATATCDGAGHCTATVTAGSGSAVSIEAGDVVDGFGNVNGARAEAPVP